MDPRLLPTTFKGRLFRVVEETGEVLQIIGKAGRFGWTARDPYTGINYDNWAIMKYELGDLWDAILRFSRLRP